MRVIHISVNYISVCLDWSGGGELRPGPSSSFPPSPASGLLPLFRFFLLTTVVRAGATVTMLMLWARASTMGLHLRLPHEGQARRSIDVTPKEDQGINRKVEIGIDGCQSARLGGSYYSGKLILGLTPLYK